jgi:hypothetical protein
MVDLQSHHESDGDAGMYPRGVAATPMPAWVKIFGAIYLIIVAIFAAMHLAGGGMGPLDHSAMKAHAPPAEHAQHRP